MDYNKTNQFIITGGKKAKGKITVQTAKNAVLPIISACLICSGVTRINAVPDITDVSNMFKLIKQLGASVTYTAECSQGIGQDVLIDTTNLRNSPTNKKLAKSMRSSVFLLGSMLARFKQTTILLPGGCKIGQRPIDIHIDALSQLGVKSTCEGDKVFFDARQAKAGNVTLKKPSVGATENVILFACTLSGKTKISNVAKEPEVVDLINFLNKCGANIAGAGKNILVINGVKNLTPASYTPISDRIVAATLLVAAAITGGEITLQRALPEHNKKLIKKLVAIGCQIKSKNDIIHLSSKGQLSGLGRVKTKVYPGFPTDEQSLVLALATQCNGKTRIEETIFENRFLTLQPLKRMGANIKYVSNQIVRVVGKTTLNPATLLAKDLRGGAALVLASLACTGTSVVKNVQLIDRGYDHLELMLSSVGLDVKRI